MKILYNDSIDAKIASVILYQKYALNYGIDIKADGFQVVNNYKELKDVDFNYNEYVCIIGIPLDIPIYNTIEHLISDLGCKVLYITDSIKYQHSLTDLYSLYERLNDNGLSLKIACDEYESLSMLAWVVSRYKLEDDISKLFEGYFYDITDGFEYLVFDNEPEKKYSIPWLIRFISDFKNLHENIIPETNDFIFGIDRMKNIISSHVNWDRLLSDDKEVMQIMTSGIPIREYVERNDLVKRSDIIPQEIKLNYLQRFVKKLFKI